MTINSKDSIMSNIDMFTRKAKKQVLTRTETEQIKNKKKEEEQEEEREYEKNEKKKQNITITKDTEADQLDTLYAVIVYNLLAKEEEQKQTAAQREAEAAEAKA